VKIDGALMFVPKNTNPKEFKRLQQQVSQRSSLVEGSRFCMGIFHGEGGDKKLFNGRDGIGTIAMRECKRKYDGASFDVLL
jgi:hypothetical protein